jgi:hypothetical protein
MSTFPFSYLGPGEASTGGTATGRNIVSSFGTFTIRKGDSYGPTSDQTLTVEADADDTWPEGLDTWTVTFTATKIDKSDGTAASGIGPIDCTVESDTEVTIPLTIEDTDITTHRRRSDDVNGWEWDLQAAKEDERYTLASGTLTVLPEITVEEAP